MKDITPKQLKSRLDAGETIDIIDVREDWEVAQGMIANAIHIPMDDIPDAVAGKPVSDARSIDSTTDHYDLSGSIHRSSLSRNRQPAIIGEQSIPFSLADHYSHEVGAGFHIEARR